MTGNPVVMRTDRNGVPLWTTQLYPELPGHMSQLVLDDDGRLAGIVNADRRLVNTDDGHISSVFQIDTATGGIAMGP